MVGLGQSAQFIRVLETGVEAEGEVGVEAGSRVEDDVEIEIDWKYGCSRE